MKNRIYSTALILFLFIGLGLFSSCEEERIYRDRTPVDEFHEVMEQIYFWIDSIPEVDPNSYSDPSALLEAMRFSPKDKWSYITTKEEHSQYYQEGTYVGYGFGYMTDDEGKIRITFLFEDSELNDHGITRGWIINKVNGTTIDELSSVNTLMGADDIGVSNTFEFISPAGEVVSQSFSKKLITMNTVGYEKVIDVGGTKVGYFNFKSFINPSIDELTEVFNVFNTEGVEELVIDLRYNGGGSLDVADKLLGLIIPDHVNGKEAYSLIYNDFLSGQYNSEYAFEQDASSLKLNKVYFIAGSGSASASELVINSLDPYIDVYIVGDDTYGKPVGMNAIESDMSDLLYVPITFKLINSDDFGDYYGGLVANSYVQDDIKHDFGEGEAILDEVLNHIRNGSFSSTKSKYDIRKQPKKEIRSIKDEIGAI